MEEDKNDTMVMSERVAMVYSDKQGCQVGTEIPELLHPRFGNILDLRRSDFP